VIRPERLKSRMKERGFSQSELARRVQVTQSSIYSLVSGDAYGSKHLHKIARVLGTTPAWLEGETDDPDEGALPDPTPELIAEQLDLVGVASIDLAYGMGGTFTDVPVEEEVRHFPRAFVASLTDTPPEHLSWARGKGDSMAPTISDGDWVLIDRSHTRILEQDDIWALSVGDVGMIKRVRLRPEGLVLLSDNRSVPPEEATGDEVRVVGRIAFIGRRR
jgi:phage repressor protein C with HTH and peptisase S24 domain